MANRSKKVAVSLAAIAIDEALNDSSSDEDRHAPRKLPKSRQYFKCVSRMDDDEFRTHFRLTKSMTKFSAYIVL